MSTITIQAIQDKHAEIGKLIQAYQAQQQPRRIEVEIDRQAINLAAGEEYIGSIINSDGSAHAIILLPGDHNDINWADATAWAASIGGTLPTRIEQAMLYANHRDKFEQRAYWSCEQPAEAAGYAWYQYFFTGYQDFSSTNSKLRARAVRRVAI
jgi:hypothetical protein